MRVDLSSGEVKEEPLKEEWVELYLGGRGLGARYFLEEVPPDADPLGPENKIIISSGPLHGTPIPGSIKTNLTTKSPHTGIYLETMASGYFGPELKLAGYDAIIIEGQSEKPVYLLIKDRDVEIRDADKYWGMLTDTAQKHLSMDTGLRDAQIAVIGPAGENLVRYASVIVTPRRAFGRGGAGAVMGSKKLKAIVVKATNRSIEVNDKDKLTEVVKKMIKTLKEDPSTGEMYPTYGTNQLTSIINELGFYPTRNFQAGVFNEIDKVHEKTWREKYVIKDDGCFTCTVRCWKLALVKEGPYTGSITDGPEYETTWALGAQCGNSRLDAIISGDELCDLYGLDTITMGNTIGFVMELYERGLITKEQTDGLDFKFGNHEAIIEAIKRTALKIGKLGELLGKGVRKISEEVGQGSEGFAIHVKGLELPAYDPRGVWGMGLAYATANRGGCHLKAWTVGDEAIRGTVPRWSTEGRPELVIKIQNQRSVNNSVGICLFITKGLPWDMYPDVIDAVTGMKFTPDELLRVGARIYTLERVITTRQGVNRKDDTLPSRITDEPIPEGPSGGKKLAREDLEQMLNRYYELRGWDENGIPKEDTLRDLGMEEVIPYLRRG